MAFDRSGSASSTIFYLLKITRNCEDLNGKTTKNTQRTVRKRLIDLSKVQVFERNNLNRSVVQADQTPRRDARSKRLFSASAMSVLAGIEGSMRRTNITRYSFTCFADARGRNCVRCLLEAEHLTTYLLVYVSSPLKHGLSLPLLVPRLLSNRRIPWSILCDP